MKLVDTHAHLYLKEFEKDINEVVQNAKNIGVTKVLLPNVDKDSANDLVKLCEQDPTFFIPMMGLHPCYVTADYRTQLGFLKELLFRQEIKIVGEIGLDYYWSTEFKTEQIDAFRTQIAWAKEKNYPIAVHCRNSYSDILNILEEEQDGTLRGVLHCFSGNLEEAQRLIDINFMMGIGGVITFKNSGLDKVIEHVAMEHLILETDAPYLAPAPHRGKRNEIAYVSLVAEKLAIVKGLSINEVATITTANASKLFQLDL